MTAREVTIDGAPAIEVTVHVVVPALGIGGPAVSLDVSGHADRGAAVRRTRDERGSALVELSWLGILLMLPMLWIVMSVFEVQRGAFGVSAAARAAARAYALAPDDATGLARAREAARHRTRRPGRARGDARGARHAVRRTRATATRAHR